MLPFDGQQLSLQVNAPCITGERTVAADDSMARNHDSNGVVVVRHSDGAGGAGLTYGFGDFPIGPRFSIRNPQQLRPNGLLEGSSFGIQGKVELSSSALKVFRK